MPCRRSSTRDVPSQSPSGKWTHGWKRAEILSVANGITLLVVAEIVTAEAVSRLIHLPTVDGAPVIVVAVAGIVVNVAATWVRDRRCFVLVHVCPPTGET